MDQTPLAGIAKDTSVSESSRLSRIVARVLGTASNALGQLRVSVDNTPNVGTVTTITTVATVTTANNLVQVGGIPAALDQYYLSRAAASGVRSRIS